MNHPDQRPQKKEKKVKLGYDTSLKVLLEHYLPEFIIKTIEVRDDETKSVNWNKAKIITHRRPKKPSPDQTQ